jgi:hypothetical protein
MKRRTHLARDLSESPSQPLKTFSHETEKMLFAALVGPIIGAVPACVFLETVSVLFDTPLVPFINGYLFGDGDFIALSKFAVTVLVLVFYPANLFVGLPAALLLRRFHRPIIHGLIIAPLLVGLGLSLVTMRFDLVVVILSCAMAVGLGCWLAFRIAEQRL